MESAFRVNASLFTVVPVPKVLNTFCSIAISALSNLCIASLYSTISCTKPTVDWCPPISRVGAGASAATGAAARLFSSLLPRPNSAPLPPPVQDGCRNPTQSCTLQRVLCVWGQIPFSQHFRGEIEMDSVSQSAELGLDWGHSFGICYRICYLCMLDGTCSPHDVVRTFSGLCFFCSR
jgi:hypothetical protein